MQKKLKAKIYRPAKTAMQSGRGNTQQWVLEFDRESPMQVDSLMGWTSCGDMRRQVKLKFETRELAEAYAKREGIDVKVIEPQQRTLKHKSYAANFS